jgi:DNA-directed RNA polymerase subunit beta'
MDFNAPSVILRTLRIGLQSAVDALLDNERCRMPQLGTTGHQLDGVSLHLKSLAKRKGTLREGILDRPADYSARTRIAANLNLDVDWCELPERLAFDLYRPLLIGELKSCGAADTIMAATGVLRRRDAAAYTALDAVCSRALVLVAPASAPWPLVALRVRLTKDLALKVSGALLDRIGWKNLGKEVLLFSVLTTEAESQAQTRLLPSTLGANFAANNEKAASFFDLHRNALPDQLAAWAVDGRTFDLGQMDHLILCTDKAFPSS